MCELLSPVGDFDCLKAAVQSGADCVYFGGELFNARASASNFNYDNLKRAVDYAKLRDVKVNFTLNTLIKDDEFQEAIELAEYVNNLGVDGIIVQDLGLAKYIIDNFPDMPVHASTQMAVHNLQGVTELEKLGFSRVVLARELPLHEIEFIAKNSNIETEVFVHGALCISYSGQCLFSSMVGGRSGNRGKCAQPCRLPYELYKEEHLAENSTNKYLLNKGYLLSPKDLCGLKFIPELINAGVDCFKIEGRLKPPEYVATVTRIYRKYIDLAKSEELYEVEDTDIEDLMLVFNRGGFSSGNFENEANRSYVFKEKPNNMGIYVGNVSKVNPKKAYITFETKEKLEIGNCFSVSREDHKYTISEMMDSEGNNIRYAKPGRTITIGRILGNVKQGDKIYKLSSNQLQKYVMEFANQENKKIPLSAMIDIRKGKPISLIVNSEAFGDSTFSFITTTVESDTIPEKAINTPLTEERVIKQLQKTNDTQFEFVQITVNMDDDIFLPKISALNELRRRAIDDIQKKATKRYERYDVSQHGDIVYPNRPNIKKDIIPISKTVKLNNNETQIALQLNNLNLDFKYNNLNNVEALYIPIRYFADKAYNNLLVKLSRQFDLYILFPTIIRDNYKNIIFNNLAEFIEKFDIKGLVITNIAGLQFAEIYKEKLEIVARFTMNIFNTYTLRELKEKGVSRVQLSYELDENTLIKLTNSSPLPTEFLYYGRVPLMNMGYCLLGESNKCYPECTAQCRNQNNRFFLKDRMGYEFPVYPDNLQTVTTIYNSKINSIAPKDLNVDYKLISILDEDIERINDIIDSVREGIAFEGNEFTSGNLNRLV